jgi:hypothetical protein
MPKQKWTKDEVLEAYKKLCKGRKVRPTKNMIVQIGNGSLLWPLRKYFKNFSNVHRELGIPNSRKPHNYWTKENTVSEIRKFLRENQNLLKQKSFFEVITLKRLYSLQGAINKHKGLCALNDEHDLGLDLRKKWTKESTLREYELLYNIWKIIPSQSMMSKKGYGGLMNAIRKHFRSLKNIRRELGLIEMLKPHNYWTEKNTLLDLKKFILENKEQINKLSFAKTIILMKKTGLQNAIQKHGGLKYLNKKNKLGLALRGEWTRAKVIQSLSEMHQAGQVVSCTSLRQMGKGGLLRAVYKFGGFEVLKKVAGIPEKKQRCWTDSSISAELKSIKELHGFFPSITLLKTLERTDLIAAIYRKGGLIKFGKLLKEFPRTLFLANDGDYLQSSYECIFDNILSKYKTPHQVHVRISPKHLYKCDFLIGDTYIEIAGYYRTNSDAYEVKMKKKVRLYKRLKKKHIIIPQKFFCRRIGVIEKDTIALLNKINLESKTALTYTNGGSIKPATYWADFKNIKKELAPFIHKYRRMPTIKELYRDNKASLANAIYRYHGTTYEIAQKLKLKSRQVPQLHYTEQKTVADYREFCIAHGKSLTMKELYSLNLRALAHAIIKYKGFLEIRRKCKLGHALRRVRLPQCTRDEAILEYRKICRKFRRFLNLAELRENGQTRIASFMCQRGLSIFAAQQESGLKYPMYRLPPNYYTLPNVVQAYKKECRKYGCFMTQEESNKVLPSSMIEYIKRTIGFTELRKLTKLKY